MKSLLAAMKGPRQYGSRCICKARVAPQGLVENRKKLRNVYRPCIFVPSRFPLGGIPRFCVNVAKQVELADEHSSSRL